MGGWMDGWIEFSSMQSSQVPQSESGDLVERTQNRTALPPPEGKFGLGILHL